MTTKNKQQQNFDEKNNLKKAAIKEIFKNKNIKRANTQNRENPMRTENSFENTLCKISESGLEQLSIVQSDDLFKDCDNKHI